MPILQISATSLAFQRPICVMSPITASGASAQYERMYKKHFSNRGPSFALRETLSSSPNVDGLPSSSSPAASGSTSPLLTASATLTPAVMDPFAGSFRASKGQSSRSDPVLVPTAAPSHVVDVGTQAALQNLGYRIRSRVSLGYNRSQSTTNVFNTDFGTSATPMTEREVLRSVTSSARSWSRSHSAPTAAANFDGLRDVRSLSTIVDHSADADGDIAMDNNNQCSSDAQLLSSAAAWRKRGRDMNEEQDCPPELGSTSTPSLSFSSSSSGSTSNFLPDPSPTVPPAVASQRIMKPMRHHAPLQTEPVLTKHTDDEEMELQHPQPSSPIRYNFQDWIDRTDF